MPAWRTATTVRARLVLSTSGAAAGEGDTELLVGGTAGRPRAPIIGIRPANLPHMTPAEGLEFLVELARQSDAIALEWFRSTRLAVELKADRTPVTEADR